MWPRSVTVELILEEFAAGETIENLFEDHPRLPREGVLAAPDFAAKALKADVVYPRPGEAAGESPGARERATR